MRLKAHRDETKPRGENEIEREFENNILTTIKNVVNFAEEMDGNKTEQKNIEQSELEMRYSIHWASTSN